MRRTVSFWTKRRKRLVTHVGSLGSETLAVFVGLNRGEPGTKDV